MYKRLLIFILAGSLVWACTEEYQQAYSERVDANQSGIVGTWEGTVLQKEYAKALKDSLGNTVVDDKNRTVWYDTVEVIDAWTEAILFSSNGGLDSFAISTSMDSLEAGILKDIQNMPLKSGEWAVINTINILQCADGGLGGNEVCDFSNGYILRPNPTGEGSVQLEMIVGDVGSGRCDAIDNNCVVIVNDGGSLSEEATLRIPITFAE